MRRGNLPQSPWIFVLGFATFVSTLPNRAMAVELIQVTEKNYSNVVPRGKEADAIIGDWVLRNNRVSAVIAQTTPGRKANMTVRGVGGMLIDYTTRFHGSDQLSCFYPAGGRYLFEDQDSFTVRLDDGPAKTTADVTKLKAKSIEVIVVGQSVADDQTQATVTYSLRDDQEWIEYSVAILNSGESATELRIEENLRCDGNLFETGKLEKGFHATDSYFGQSYLFLIDGHSIVKEGGRTMQLRTEKNESKQIEPGQELKWSGQVLCSQGLPGIHGLLESLRNDMHLDEVTLLLRSKAPREPIQHAQVEYFKDGESLGIVLSDEKGFVRSRFTAGEYQAKISPMGHQPRELMFTIENRTRADTLTFEPASRIRAVIVDENRKPIAAKVQFIGVDGTNDPNFGPDSAIYALKNVVYCANGRFEQAIPPGSYRVIVSHGPEYDADYQEIVVEPGQLVPLESSLERVVDTTGWISSEFHSHSSPSGDNVSHQTGRVLNLLAEHLEFAPCTEHNRIDTYADDLELLGATQAMATCTGMELTGGPLPINHQNAFPLVRHVHSQDGGGPQTDVDPVKQIERLALWDNSSQKVIQANHPNIPSILGDRDLDGKPDEGFRGMLGWMDAIEVHPPEGIFSPPSADVAPDDRRNPIFYWLQLLNIGYRISGVVNTDAHYNFHGSGWLRNYMECSTDNPAEISIDEMIHVAEHGHMVMTTGPFLQAEFRTSGTDLPLRFAVGEDVPLHKMPEASGKIWIRVQCPNWFDVNRVQVFANGRPLPNMNFTRKDTQDFFSDEVVRFEVEANLPKFEQDTHLIVATIGEGLKLGPVMGPDRGELPPVAVTNPIFVDVDGGGFQGNGDDLGVPLMLDAK